MTGLAAGFGYNRGLTIPAIDQVEAFPLIQAATVGQNGSGVPSLPAGQKQQQELLTARLEALEEYIPGPSVNTSWRSASGLPRLKKSTRLLCLPPNLARSWSLICWVFPS